MKKTISISIKACFIFFVIFTIYIVFLPNKIVAGVTSSRNQILDQAISYNDWDYENINNTFVVTRTLNDLGIAKHIVGTLNSTSTSDEMYENALSNPDEAEIVWEGYVSDLSYQEHNLSNGDVLIQRTIDSDDSIGNAGFIHISETAIALYGLNNEKNKVEDTILVDAQNEQTNQANSNTYITIFRLSNIKPKFASITSKKSVIVDINIKPVNSKEHTATSDSQTEYQYLYTGDSNQIVYCTNFVELDNISQQQLLEDGVFTSEYDAIVFADEQAQQQVLEIVKQSHLSTNTDIYAQKNLNSNVYSEEMRQSQIFIFNNESSTSSHHDQSKYSGVVEGEKNRNTYTFYVVLSCISLAIVLLFIVLIIITIKIKSILIMLVFKKNH